MRQVRQMRQSSCLATTFLASVSLAVSVIGCASHSTDRDVQSPKATAAASKASVAKAQAIQHVDPATVGSLNEAQRRKLLETIILDIIGTCIHHDAPALAEITVSLVPDDESMDLFLADSTPPTIRRRLSAYFAEERANLSRPDRAELLFDVYPRAFGIEVHPMSLELYHRADPHLEWKQWVRPGIQLYEIVYVGRDQSLPFYFWDGQRWLNISAVRLASVLPD